jgi:hypothetical protein
MEHTNNKPTRSTLVQEPQRQTEEPTQPNPNIPEFPITK